VWTSERIAVAYFTYLAVVCWLRPIAAARRLTIASASVASIAAIAWLSQSGLAGPRAWAPAATILVGYYVSGLLFFAPSLGVEAWLMAWDRRLLGDPSTRFAAWPRPLLAYLEIVYMACFVVIGAGFLILVLNGHAAMADRYWTLVVAAELGSFAPLAFIQTRPPWAIERKPVLADPAIHDLAERMVQRFTIRANTFPSGHVAGSLAVAFAVAGVMPWTGAVLFLLAITIAVATVVGRYHYVVDAVAGAALATALWLGFAFP
jgi:membrane-associated phospholipid phosphatase